MAEFEEYFKSDKHFSRIQDAQKRTEERLIIIFQGDIYHGVSEVMGTVFGAASVMKSLGFKRLWPKINAQLFKFMKTGSDT